MQNFLQVFKILEHLTTLAASTQNNEISVIDFHCSIKCTGTTECHRLVLGALLISVFTLKNTIGCIKFMSTCSEI